MARRYVAASPFAIRGLAGVMREVAGLAAALLARTPNISKMETRLGVPRISNLALAAEFTCLANDALLAIIGAMKSRTRPANDPVRVWSV